MGYLHGAEAARIQANQPGTAQKRSLSWDRWLIFVDSIGLGSNPFLERFEPRRQNNAPCPKRA